MSDAAPAPGVSLTGFTAKGAAFRAARTTNDDGLLDIVIGAADDVCHAARTERFTKSLHLTLHAKGAMAPGTFPVVDDTVMGGSGPAPQATVFVWNVYDVGPDRCALSGGDEAVTGGTITIASVGESIVEGTLAITLRKGGPVSGAFQASACARPDDGTHACALGH